MSNPNETSAPEGVSGPAPSVEAAASTPIALPVPVAGGPLHPPPNNGYAPPFVVLFGKSGLGKTADAGAAFPGALFIAAPGAVASIFSLYGINVTRTQVSTLTELNKHLPGWIKAGKYTALVIDELDFLADETMAALEKKVSGFKLFGALRSELTLTARIARDASIPIICTALEKPPKVKEDGTRIMGGPALTGDLPEKLPGMADLVLRAVRDPLREPWPAMYDPKLSADYVAKDRYSIAPAPSPLRLGEILRMAGFVVPRLADSMKKAGQNPPPEVRDQEAQVAELAGVLYAQPPSGDKATLSAYYQYLLGLGQTPEMSLMTVQDGRARAEIARYRRARRASFF